MKVFGYVAGAVGAGLCFFAAFIQQTAVENDFGQREIINIGLQQDRLFVFAFGLTLIIVSGIFIALDIGLTQLKADGLPSHDGGNAVPAALTVENTATPAPVLEKDLAEEMTRLDVRKDGDFYVYKQYRYERLQDALKYASDVLEYEASKGR